MKTNKIVSKSEALIYSKIRFISNLDTIRIEAGFIFIPGT